MHTIYRVCYLKKKRGSNFHKQARLEIQSTDKR